MKILQMVDVPWDSGLAHYALALGLGLKQKGHQVFVSAVPNEKPWHKAHRLGLRTLPLVKLKNLRALRRFIHDHHIDVLNAHTGSTHSLAVAAGLGQKVAVVRTRSDARAFRRRPGSTFLYRHTHRVITAADYLRKAFLKEMKLLPKKVATIYQGVDLATFSPESLPKTPILGVVARLDPVKGHRYLIEAMYLLKAVYPELALHVIGQEENVKERELRWIAERLRVDHQITFLGYQTNVAQAMNDCSIGVVSSIGSEAVSRAALEWMACGRPVVATRVGCLPEIVQDGVSGYIAEPKDAPSLAAAIAKVLHEPEKAKALGGSALSRAKRHYAMPQFIEKTLDVYKSALQEL